MGRQQSTRFLNSDSFQVLELPYDDHEISMLVFLPRRTDGFRDFEQILSAARVSDWLARMTVHDVEVTRPRFKVTAEPT